MRDRDYSPQEISAVPPHASQGDGGGLPRGRSQRGGHHGPRVLRRLASARPRRTPGGSPGSTVLRIVNEPTAAALALRPRRAARRATQDRRLRPRAAAPSTSRSSSSARASSRSSPPRATRSWAARTSISASSTGCSRCSTTDTGIDLRTGPPGPPATEGVRREGQVRAVAPRGDGDQPPVHLRGRKRRAPPQHDADARQVRRARRGPHRKDQGPVRGGPASRGLEARRHRRGRAGGRPDPHAEGHRDRARRSSAASRTRSINPDEVVGIGAAIQAGILKGDVKDMVLLDVTPLSLGIETRGGMFTKIIDRNSTIPTRKSQDLHHRRGQPVEGRGPRACRASARSPRTTSRSGGSTSSASRPLRKGTAQIEVTFDIDSNGIVNVSARDLATKREQKILVTPAGGLVRIRDPRDHRGRAKARGGGPAALGVHPRAHASRGARRIEPEDVRGVRSDAPARSADERAGRSWRRRGRRSRAAAPPSAPRRSSASPTSGASCPT